MLVVAILGCFVAAILVLALLGFSRSFAVEAVYRRMAWVPIGALFVEAALWKPMTQHLSYFAVVPPLLTCLASLLLAVMGATLVASSRQRGENIVHLARATLVASIPGVMLLCYVLYGLMKYVRYS